MSKIVLTNNGTVDQSIMNHGAGRVLVPAGETVTITLDHAKDQVSQAYLKKFYNQYAESLAITFDIDDYPLAPETVAASASKVTAKAETEAKAETAGVETVAVEAKAAKKSTK